MDYKGLTEAEAQESLKRHGYNEIPEKKSDAFRKLVKWVLTPITLMMLAASGLSFSLGRRFDGVFILVLLLINAAVGVWQERKADAAIKKLNAKLRSEAKVLRDGVWKRVDSRELAVGDVFELAVGEIIPADGEVLSSRNVAINESALTGESEHKEKKPGDKLFGGSFVSTGQAVAKVTATGKDSYFGKVLFSVERSRHDSLLEKDVIRISRFLSALALIAVVILTAVLFLARAPLAEIVTLDLSLVIAGVPISLPTVMTLIIEFGVIALSAKDVIVRRISALEDLANVNLLMTDKTGTMTKNDIAVQMVVTYGRVKESDVLRYAASGAKDAERSLIDLAILKRAQDMGLTPPSADDYVPPDSERKRATAFATEDGKPLTISVGAPQVIAGLCKEDDAHAKKHRDDVDAFAKKGYRTVSVAVRKGAREEKDMEIIGLLALSDSLREDAADVVAFLQEKGVGVKLVTGDNAAIAKEIARELALDGAKVATAKDLDGKDWASFGDEAFEATSVFAEVLPGEKRELIRLAAKRHVVAAAGDGVNDLPALKEANVGIAVNSAVDALKSSADIVLLTDGIAVFKEAILESRKIFARLYSYSVYRISESFRLIITIVGLGVAVGGYPLTPIQIILLALLNDIPIVSMATDRVKADKKPSTIPVKERFLLSSLYGLVGVANSLIVFFGLRYLGYSWELIQTVFFLKLSVSGHMLIYVAHTKERWWKWLPSKQVIVATTLTQLIATALALTGFLMPTKVSPKLVALVWAWAFVWMQVGELMKEIRNRRIRANEKSPSA